MRVALAFVLVLALANADAAREPRTSRLYQQWKQADRNGDGELSRGESAAMPALGEHFDAIDRDGNGRLSADEVRAWRNARRSKRRAQPGGMAVLFTRADANGDGVLSRPELEAALPRVARNFARIDVDRNGLVDRAELDAWLTRRAPVRSGAQ